MTSAPGGDTIFALSSGAPPAAIALVRISGPQAGSALRSLAGGLPRPRHATLRTLVDANGAQLDRGLVLWFPGPASATGEDLAELHLHGGRAVAAAVLRALAGQPACRPAVAGEFTRRAFGHGRIDLAQAEGLADLLAAETETQRRNALRLADGGLSAKVADWSSRLLAIAATVEAAIEFAEEEPDAPQDIAIGPALNGLVEDVRHALAHAPAERLKDGFRIVIAGPPNVGKSSLINVLTGRDIAIVTDQSGTTRDLIEAPVTIGQHACVLIDSAGLRDAHDPVEAIGVARAEAAIAGADILLWLGAPQACPAHVKAIKLQSRADLLDNAPPADVDLSISSFTGHGIDNLVSRITEMLDEIMPRDDGVMLNVRQRQAVTAAALSLEDAKGAPDLVLIAHKLQEAAGALDQITGRSGVENMLDALFGTFCIGK